MHPAYSVIVFTTTTGAGYGLLAWLCLAPPGTVDGDLAGLLLALLLVTVGLLASTFHLGRPERAWRAFSQWRSSWLSREGVAAVATYPVALAWGWARWQDHAGVDALAIATTALAAVTVYCTAMIYASLKPIPRWNTPWVPAAYLALAAATGGLLHHGLAAALGEPLHTEAVGAAVALAWVIKFVYWQTGDAAQPRATTGEAIGLPERPRVSLFAAPSTQANFVQREMGFRVARRHAGKLRRIAVMGTIAAVSLVFATPGFDGAAATAWAVLAALVGLASVLIERWLFFAEARHLVSLYYGAEAV